MPTELPVVKTVESGTYSENINFLGKKIVVKSKDPDNPEIVASTIIDGQGLGSVVIFENEETGDSVMCGFTLQNGESTYGGGIRCNNSSPTITDCIISNNKATEGGGIYCFYSSPIIINCILSQNTVNSRGGGIYCYSSSADIYNCTISQNQANIEGGGFYSAYSSPIITNSIIANNMAYGKGGGLYDEYSSLTTINCTIAKNLANDEGGGFYCLDSSLNITNCIIWGNQPEGICGCTPTIIYSCIQGDFLGEGNISSDPQFINVDVGDFHLKETSPCIDAGLASVAPDLDKDYNKRELASMGDYELALPNPPIVYIQKEVTTDRTPTWTWESGGGTGTGIFRYKLDDQYFIDTNETEFTPNSQLSYGYHTLWVQECNLQGAWSRSASKTLIIQESDMTIMNIPKGWSMISLPVVEPDNNSFSSLFLDSVVVYSYKSKVGYVRVKNKEDLKVGKGYWILLDQTLNYTLSGQPIQSHTNPVNTNGWYMIGGCGFSAKFLSNNCTISAIYGYGQNSGYKRIPSAPGKACKIQLVEKPS